MEKESKKIYIGPSLILIAIIFIVSILSFVFSKLGIDGQKTVISSGNLETVLISINNIFSIDGIKFILGSIMSNNMTYSLIINTIVIIFGFSICDEAGLFKHIFSPLKKRKSRIITLILVILCLLAVFFGSYAYLLMLPFSALMYKYTNNNPILGLITAFISITIFQTITCIYDYNTYILGNLTQLSANINVDKNFKFLFTSSLYMKVAVSISFIFFITYVIQTFYKDKFKKVIYEDNKNINTLALVFSLIFFIVSIGGIVFLLLTNKIDFLLDNTNEHYLAKIFSNSSIINQSLIFIFSIVLSISGIIYGFISKNISNTYDMHLALTNYFEKFGSVFLLIFLSNLLTSIITWTNIGEVVTVNLVSLLSVINFSGITLIITFIIFVIIMTIFIPDTVSKWVLVSPIIVPLFMKSNITPEYTQILFKVADGIGKCLTPVFVYFIMLVAFMEKYKQNSEEKITIYGTYKLILKPLISLSMIILFIIIGWFIIGLPIGINVYPTL